MVHTENVSKRTRCPNKDSGCNDEDAKPSRKRPKTVTPVLPVQPSVYVAQSLDGALKGK